MRDLATAGRAVVEDPPAPPTPVELIEASARRRHRRAVRAGLAGATALVLLVGAGAVVVASRDRRQPAPATATRPTRPPTAARELSPQLRAHLGLGAPKGWMPVDYGDARLWVPSDWAVTAGGCPRTDAPGWVELGGPYKERCFRPAGAAAAYVSMTQLRDPTGIGANRSVVNTYAVYSNTLHGPGNSWSVPALHVSISDNVAAAAFPVLDTLGPSARVVALDTPAQPVPSSWRRVAYGGFSIAVPPTWPAQLVAGRVECAPYAADRVLAGTPNLRAQCGDFFQPPVPADSAWLAHFTIDSGFQAPSTQVRGPWAGGLRVGVMTDTAQTPSPLLRLAVNMDAHPAEIDIGLGRDGRVANTILHSIEGGPLPGHPTFAVAGCPAQPQAAHLGSSGSRDLLVAPNPNRALGCVYQSSANATPADQLIAARSLDPGATARALDAQPPTTHGTTLLCPLGNALGAHALVLLGYRDGSTTAVAMTDCVAEDRQGFVRSPPALWSALASLT